MSLNSWNGGFVATVRVTAGSASLTGWAVSMTLPSGAAVTNAWNADRSGNSGAVRFTNVSYNGRVAAGQTTEFGFQGTGSGTGLTPTCAGSGSAGDRPPPGRSARVVDIRLRRRDRRRLIVDTQQPHHPALSAYAEHGHHRQDDEPEQHAQPSPRTPTDRQPAAQGAEGDALGGEQRRHPWGEHPPLRLKPGGTHTPPVPSRRIDYTAGGPGQPSALPLRLMRSDILGRVTTGGSRTGRLLRGMLAVLIGVAALVGAVRLVVPATAGPTDDPPGVRRQLTFLRAALQDGAGERAQALFPEGYFFSHVLYGLTWVELGLRAPAGERDEALDAARWALSRLESPAGRAPFSPDLTPAYGVFYQGWVNWLRGGALSLQPPQRRDIAELRRFEESSIALGAAFDEAPTPFLAAYPGQAWPVDSTVAVASLRLHDSLLPARFDATVRRWLDGVRERFDPTTGLLPHRVEPATGLPAEVARGTSQSIIHRFLPEIDPVLAREQYLAFRDRFVVSPFNLGPAVREYPVGLAGPSDVDSGPLLLGVSLSATVVTLGAAQTHGDAALAGALANYGELLGAPVDTPWTRRYALGQLPVGDAFLAWSKSARPWLLPVPTDSAPPASVGWTWRLPLLGILLLIGVLPWVPALIRLRRRRADPAPALAR